MAFEKLKYRITADASEFQKGLKKANTAFDRFTRKNRYKIRRVKRAVAGATAAVGALGVAMAVDATKQAAKFERSLISAGSKAGATAGQLEAMKDAALEASAASEFGAGEAADALGFLAQAGFEVEEQISALPGVLNLASAGEIELAESADIASNVLSGFGEGVDQVGRVNDVLVKTANSANTSVRQLGDALSYAAPTAAGAGIEIEEAAAVIGKLSDAGIQGSRAGRGFNQILTRMRDVAGQLGVEMTAADVEADGFAGSLERLEDAGLTAGNAVDFFGREAGPAIQAVLGQGVGAVTDLSDALDDAGGTAQSVARDKIETLSGAMNVLEGNFQNLRIVVGDQFKPAVTETAIAMGEFTNELKDNDQALSDLSDAIVKTIDVGAEMVRWVGFTGNVLTTLVGVFGDLGAVLKSVALQIGALGGALVSMGQAAVGQFSAAKESFDVMAEMQQGAIDAMLGVGDATKAASAQGDKFQASAFGIADSMQNMAARIRSATDDAKKFNEEQEKASESAKIWGAMFGDDQVDYTKMDPGASAPEPTRASTTGGGATGKTAAEKEREELERFAETIRDDVMTDSEKLDQQLGRLGEAYNAGMLSLEDYHRATVKAQKALDPTRQKTEELRKESDKLSESLGEVDGAFAENIGKLRDQFEEGQLDADEFAAAMGRVEDAAESYSGLSRSANRLKESLKGPTQVAQEQADEYKRMLDERLISEEQYQQAVQRLRDEVAAHRKQQSEEENAEALQRAQEQQMQMQQMMSTIGGGVGQVLGQVSGGFFDKLKEDADSAKDEFLVTITEMVAEGAAKLAVLSAFQAAGGSDTAVGSLLGGIGGFADGGYVSGPGTSKSDSIPARLSDGEFVMPAAAVQKYGVGFMESVRRMKAPSTGGSRQRFASGGLAKSDGGGGGEAPVIANFVDPDLFEQFLSSGRGRRAMLNFVSANGREIDAAKG